MDDEFYGEFGDRVLGVVTHHRRGDGVAQLVDHASFRSEREDRLYPSREVDFSAKKSLGPNEFDSQVVEK